MTNKEPSKQLVALVVLIIIGVPVGLIILGILAMFAIIWLPLWITEGAMNVLEWALGELEL